MPDESVDVLHQRVRTELEALDLDPAGLRAPALRSAIRGRRRATGWGAAGAGALVVAGLAFAVPPLLPSGGSAVVTPGGTVTQPPTPAPEGAPPACGQPFAVAPALDGLRSSSMKEPSLPLDGPGIVEFTVTLTNPTAARLTGTTGHVDLFVVQDGRIVAVPGAKRSIGFAVDLAPQESMPLTGGLALQDCRAGSTPPDGSGKQDVDGPPVTLPAGTYEVYGEAVVSSDTGGPETVVRGGPWPLTLR